MSVPRERSACDAGGAAGRTPTPAALWERVRRRSQAARQSGVLQPIPSAVELVPDAGIEFVVRIAPGLARKPSADAARPRSANPFLPYDRRLHVADLSATHVALLNRFPVLENHLLLVTRSFEDQRSPLGPADFEALALALAGSDALGFYNAGAVAGASQAHKHLQVVPLPLGPGRHAIPIEPRLARLPQQPGPVPGLPFAQAGARLTGPDAAEASYRALLRALAIDPARIPYNLLVTRRWMLLVPRRRPASAGIEVNALGFAGALLVRSREQLGELRARGALGLLREVGEPTGRTP